MKKKKFSESQIITVLKGYGAGVPAAELARKYGIGESTIYTWQTKYGDMELSELKRLRQLEDENTRLKKMYATVVNLPNLPQFLTIFLLKKNYLVKLGKID